MSDRLEMPSESPDGGLFGGWTVDKAGLPAFEYTALRYAPPREATDIDHWSQVGNDRYTAEAHAGGWMVPYRWERGLTRLSGKSSEDWRDLAGVTVVHKPDGAGILLLKRELGPEWSWNVTWGISYAEWLAESGGRTIGKRVEAPFGDDPVLLIEIEVKGVDGPVFLEERWPILPYTVGIPLPMTRYMAAPEGVKGTDRVAWRAITGFGGGVRRIGEHPRRLYSRLLDWKITDGSGYVVAIPSYKRFIPSPKDGRRSLLENSPRPVFMAVLEGDARPMAEFIPGGVLLAVRSAPMDGSGKIRLLFGWSPENGIGDLVGKYRENRREQWGSTLPRLMAPGYESLEREITWHGGYLRGMMVKDDYLESHIIPQGSAYSYLHGAHGAIRDYVLSIVPLIYLAPDRAREFIMACARCVVPTGEILYSHVGFGQSSGAGGLHAAPTDLSLFVLWAIVEYVAATGDAGLLDEAVPFYPKENGKSSTMRERVSLAWRYMRDRVGTGPHDLLRAGTGDWNDPISYYVDDPRLFHKRGESCYNTAMALWVLPRVAELVETWSESEAMDIRRFAGFLESSMKHAWTGEWYLRGWDGRNRPLGEDRPFLDSSVWCLISGVGGRDRMRRLVSVIKQRLDDPSPIGANILDRPVRMKYGILAPGWDCNGGVWAALNGLLCWGYSLYDPDLAWRNLEKQSLAAHARAYPHVWYGIWSGPDSYNAHWARDPGHTFIHPLTPMREYPIMNSNSHAMPLLGLLKLAGCEPHGLKLETSPRMPAHFDQWKIEFPLLTIEFSGGKIVRS